MECPEMAELAAFAEAGTIAEESRAHISACDACQDALQMLEEEILSLQIPLSELWFREHVSCPHGSVLGDYRDSKLSAEAADYVRFHVEELACPFCQARLEQSALEDTEEGRASIHSSRQRVGEATSALLDSLKRG